MVLLLFIVGYWPKKLHRSMGVPRPEPIIKLLRIFQSVKHLPVAEDFFQKEKDR